MFHVDNDLIPIRDFEHMMEDADLRTLHDRPDFNDLIKPYLEYRAAREQFEKACKAEKK